MDAPQGAVRRRVYLMRHADVSYFDADGRPVDPRHVTLTEAGARNALAAGELLRHVAFDASICSGLPRTEQTAKLVLGDREIALRHEPRLKEIRAGRLHAVPAGERERVIAYAYDGAAEPGASFIGGESWEGFESRVLEVWRELLTDDSWINVLVVAHDAVNRLLMSHVAGNGLAGLKAFEQDPACINIIELDLCQATGRRAFLRTVNLVAYNLTGRYNHRTVMEKVWAEFEAGCMRKAAAREKQ